MNAAGETPILVVEFESLLHPNGTPIPEPMAGVLAFLRRAQDRYRIQVFGPSTDTYMRFWFWRFGAADLAESLEFPEEKPAAFVTLDDLDHELF